MPHMLARCMPAVLLVPMRCKACVSHSCRRALCNQQSESAVHHHSWRSRRSMCPLTRCMPAGCTVSVWLASRHCRCSCHQSQSALLLLPCRAPLAPAHLHYKEPCRHSTPAEPKHMRVPRTVGQLQASCLCIGQPRLALGRFVSGTQPAEFACWHRTQGMRSSLVSPNCRLRMPECCTLLQVPALPLYHIEHPALPHRFWHGSSNFEFVSQWHMAWSTQTIDRRPTCRNLDCRTARSGAEPGLACTQQQPKFHHRVNLRRPRLLWLCHHRKGRYMLASCQGPSLAAPMEHLALVWLVSARMER